MIHAQLFQKQGYIVCHALELEEDLKLIKKEIYSIFDTVSKSKGGGPINSDQGIIQFHQSDSKHQYQSVRLSWGAPTLYRIAGHPDLLKKLHDLGLEMPVLELAPLIRCDLAKEERSMFLTHQDYAYGIGSHNSVTVWIPLQDTDEKLGVLMCVPGSHVNGVFPNKSGLIIDDEHFNFVSCPVNFGSLLILNQKVVHKSGRNTTNQVRLSIQLRYSDLSDSDYAKRGFPINHRITFSRFEGDVQ